MTVLFVVPYAPNLIRVRPYNLIRSLLRRGHRIVVATLWTNEREREDLEALARFGADVRAHYLPAWRSIVNCVEGFIGGDPLQVRYSWSAALLREILELAPQADVVHVEHLRGARFGLAALAAQADDPSATPVVWDAVDCITHLFEQAAQKRPDFVGRLINQLELPRTRRFEGASAGRFDRVLVTSSVDREAFLRLAGDRHDDQAESRLAVLTNGVDLDYFTPDPGQARDADMLVFSGKMSYHANESAALHLLGEIMPRIWARRPSTRLQIVGKDPSERLRAALARHASRASLTGTVLDLRPFLRGAAAAVVPLVYGTGCQNKVLEAMACATPVVATSQAVSSLRVLPGRDVFVADAPDVFADAVLELLDAPARQREVGEAGHRYVQAHHRWDDVAGQLESVYLELAGRRGALVRRDGRRRSA